MSRGHATLLPVQLGSTSVGGASPRRVQFTKMHGAGNDFVVIDATRQPVDLDARAWRTLADRRFGIGADQILIVGPAQAVENDFSYRIINADGGEVEHCGNGARAFMRYVVDKGLTRKRVVRVEILPGVITLRMRENGDIDVDMGTPYFTAAAAGFDASGLASRRVGSIDVYTLPLETRTVEFAIASMGNPHAVQIVDDVDQAPVAIDGPIVERHTRFAHRVNVGFMQLVDRHRIRLRVWERGVGETLACGTGACAAVATGIARGLLDSPVRVEARGGELQIEWAGDAAPMVLSGPAVIVFEGEIILD